MYTHKTLKNKDLNKAISLNDFLNELFQVKYLDQAEKVEIRNFTDKSKFYGNGQISKILKRAKDQEIGENLYFGVATRDGKGGTKENCKCVYCLWLDFDFKEFTGGEKEVRKRLNDFEAESGLIPSIIVNSGHGFHVYYLLKEPLEIGKDISIQEFEAVLKGVAMYTGADLSGAECARVLRLPDTINYKPGLPPVPCYVESFKNIHHDLSTFDAYKLPTFEKKEIKNINQVSGGAGILTEKCAFMKYCTENLPGLKYNLFFPYLTNLHHFQDVDLHEICRGWLGDRYNEHETESRLNALNDSFCACNHIAREFKGCKECKRYEKGRAPVSLISHREEPDPFTGNKEICLDTFVPDPATIPDLQSIPLHSESNGNGKHLRPDPVIVDVDQVPGKRYNFISALNVLAEKNEYDFNLFIRNKPLTITGEQGAGKSTLVAYFAALKSKNEKVLIFDYEINTPYKNMITLFGKAENVDFYNGIEFKNINDLCTMLKEIPHQLVIFDTVIGLLSTLGIDSKNTIQNSELARKLLLVKKSIWLLNHYNKSDREAGSIGLIQAIQQKFEYRKDGHERILDHFKNNYEPKFIPKSYTVKFTDNDSLELNETENSGASYTDQAIKLLMILDQDRVNVPDLKKAAEEYALEIGLFKPIRNALLQLGYRIPKKGERFGHKVYWVRDRK